MSTERINYSDEIEQPIRDLLKEKERMVSEAVPGTDPLRWVVTRDYHDRPLYGLIRKTDRKEFCLVWLTPQELGEGSSEESKEQKNGRDERLKNKIHDGDVEASIEIAAKTPARTFATGCRHQMHCKPVVLSDLVTGGVSPHIQTGAVLCGLLCNGSFAIGRSKMGCSCGYVNREKLCPVFAPGRPQNE